MESVIRCNALFIDDESYLIPEEGDLHEIMDKNIHDQEQYIARLISRLELLKQWRQNSQSCQFKFDKTLE